MTKRSIRDLERQVKKEPDNLVVRLLLAAAYREAGRTGDAVPLYRSVADAYLRQGRRTQAVAVLRSLLELEPSDAHSRALLDELARDEAAAPPPAEAPPPATGPVFAVGAPPHGAPLSPRSGDSGDFARPSTIPSLEGQRLRQTGQTPAARMLSDDVVLRDLAPVRPPSGGPARGAPGADAPPEPSPATTLSGLGAAGPRARRPSSGRGSAALFTPTPLPRPVPFHEADATADHERLGRDAGSADDEDAMTRVADAFRTAQVPGEPPPLRPTRPEPRPEPRPPPAPPRPVAPTRPPPARAPAPTRPPAPRTAPPPPAPARPPPARTLPPLAAPAAPRPQPARPAPPPAAARPGRPAARPPTDTATDVDLAQDLDTRRVRRLSEHELQAATMPPPGQTHEVARVDPADLDADAVTDPDAGRRARARLASEPARDPTRDTLRETTRDTARDARPPARAATIDDEPTRWVGDPPARPSNEFDDPTGVRGDGDEPTRVATEPSSGPADRPTFSELTPTPVTAAVDPLDAAPPEPATHPGEPAARPSAPGRHRSRAFPTPFAQTIEELDPDGAAIDAPLDMFSMLPPEALAELGRRMILRRFSAGELIVREGDPGEACYVIADGEVRVLKQDPLAPEAGPVEVARLGARALFGEFALLADRRRHATVQATTACDVYEIPRYLLRELAATYPEVGPALETFYRQRLLATLLRTAPFFAPLPEEQRARLLARFVPLRAERGEPIVREGQPAGGLYLIVIGAVEITRRLGPQRSVILATLREGAYFGEMSLLSGEPTTATVVAAGTVELALLPPRDFYEIVAQHPQLWAHIRREARTRALENAKLLAGDSGTV